LRSLQERDKRCGWLVCSHSPEASCETCNVANETTGKQSAAITREAESCSRSEADSYLSTSYRPSGGQRDHDGGGAAREGGLDESDEDEETERYQGGELLEEYVLDIGDVVAVGCMAGVSSIARHRRGAEHVRECMSIARYTGLVILTCVCIPSGEIRSFCHTIA